jgi:hypothetical protein
LDRRVEAYFKEKGITGSDSPFMYTKTLGILVFWVIFYYLAIIQGYILAAFFFAYVDQSIELLTPYFSFFHNQLGVSIGHDGNHGSFSYKWPILSRIAGHAMDFFGGSRLVWLHQHNIGKIYFFSA